MEDIQDWGKFLKKLIKDSKANQKDVAKFLGMSAQNFGQKLKDKEDISIKTVISVLKYFNKDLLSTIYGPEELKKYSPPWITEHGDRFLKILYEIYKKDPQKAGKLIAAFISIIEDC
jgi:transcriptional regulator with XRE-family HTH domain